MLGVASDADGVFGSPMPICADRRLCLSGGGEQRVTNRQVGWWQKDEGLVGALDSSPRGRACEQTRHQTAHPRTPPLLGSWPSNKCCMAVAGQCFRICIDLPAAALESDPFIPMSVPWDMSNATPRRIPKLAVRNKNNIEVNNSSEKSNNEDRERPDIFSVQPDDRTFELLTSRNQHQRTDSRQSHSQTRKAPGKWKSAGILGFLALKEPSTSALEEFAELERRKMTNQRVLPGVSSQKLPHHVPKSHSKPGRQLLKVIAVTPMGDATSNTRSYRAAEARIVAPVVGPVKSKNKEVLPWEMFAPPADDQTSLASHTIQDDSRKFKRFSGRIGRK
ncbi:uncharacterized protein MYCFIDRAFT_76014 [Pseudocercospora fijiensis CIRAD86]|uniref:Uncharacterized protein n=1 Tax=Pseudocercospora fijiensis (strain CIRAD86) TaxID=383855 RepID=N1Q6Q4_PSEFD|nr:uncharacterized protein MYCFIDRAFT_76014 [Pseudocercospora fijiensis CIRAD86]EME88184.1 hypothetical protein MYCFIDRAFT_76014 [Pseudocercospora fijiensis CIRAD86]